jgi:hypothetical protein
MYSLANMEFHTPKLRGQCINNTSNIHRHRNFIQYHLKSSYSPHQINLSTSKYTRATFSSKDPIHSSREWNPRSQNHPLRVRHSKIPRPTNSPSQSSRTNPQRRKRHVPRKRRYPHPSPSPLHLTAGPFVHIACCVGNIACRIFDKYNFNDGTSISDMFDNR